MAVLFLFSWGSGLAEVMTLVVGYNAFGALKCCSWSSRCEKPVDWRLERPRRKRWLRVTPRGSMQSPSITAFHASRLDVEDAPSVAFLPRQLLLSRQRYVFGRILSHVLERREAY